MKIFLTGGSGLFGSRFIEMMADRYGIASFDRSGLPDSLLGKAQSIVGDLTDWKQVGEGVESFRPDLILHAAALTDVDLCEKEKDLARSVNVGGTLNAIKAAESQNCPLIYISTDFVFDGQKGDYVEDDRPSPINYYAQTKYQAEQAVRESKVKNLVVRPSYPYRSQFSKPDKIRWMLPLLSQGKEITVVADQFSTPTFIDDWVSALDRMIQSGSEGLYHLGGGTKASWYQVALLVCEVFGFNDKLVKPINYAGFMKGKGRAPRPMDSSLVSKKAERVIGQKMSSLHLGISKIKKENQKESNIS